MDPIPQSDLQEMDLDEAMEEEDSEEEEEQEEEDKENEDDREKEVFIPGKHKLAEGEQLVRDESAYTLYHEFQTGSPCLSFDILADDLDRTNPYPATVFVVAGTMSSQKKDHLIVLKLQNMHKSPEETPEDEEIEADPATEPRLTAAMIRHNGCVNRVRSFNFGEAVLAANWSEKGIVHVWNLNEMLKATNDKQAMNNFIQRKRKDMKPLYSFEGYTNEGYALDWNTVNKGQLLTGDNSKNIHLWRPVEHGLVSWTVEQRPFTGHNAAVEDIQWSPNEGSVFCSCSTDKSIKVWDVRAPPNKACMLGVENAHDLDVNVISWNKKEQSFLVSGGDDGVIKVWDFRKIKDKKPIANFKHHSGPITSIEWCPQDSSVFAAAGEDNQVTQWDLAVERESNEDVDVPPQLLFSHQGQEDIKEIHWHSKIEGLLLSTANTGFNVFKTISV